MENSSKVMKKRNWNKLNIVLSATCGVHCVITPFLIPIMPSLNENLGIGFFAELMILLTVCILGTYSLFHAYKKHHNVLWPFVTFICGCILLSVNFIQHHGHEHLAHSISIPVIVGTALLLISQTMNIVYSRRIAV